MVLCYMIEGRSIFRSNNEPMHAASHILPFMYLYTFVYRTAGIASYIWSPLSTVNI